MAIKKSQIYSSLWESCDTLRGGMDASQYKDYILALLFVKYVSDKAKSAPDDALYEVPNDAGFDAMLELRNKTDIGDQMNKMLTRLMEANPDIRITFPDFNDEKLLGRGKEMVDRITKLLNIFKDGLNLTKNRAGNDDLLGDAYEYLMRHFAVESGKSKGQFYTPAEVSRLLAVAIGIHEDTRPAITIYDPTCGSGSLLLRAASCASAPNVTIWGQEDVATTADLARMNMVLHGQETADIQKGNTLAAPHFMEGSKLMRFDYVVANPPFSVKNWTNGFSPQNDVFNRFEYGLPPEKMGDYAFLQHIIASIKPGTGRGACIMPHGVLFRGNAEAEIREKIVKQGFIKAIIGLPANLFYGTPIAACVLVLDKNNAANRSGIFMIDASKGFMKDGPKNRLREQDLRRIIDTYAERLECPGYSRMVPMSEIKDNDYNLNIPRYIDSGDTEVRQDIFAHLNGGIPQNEIDTMPEFAHGFASLKSALFAPSEHAGYCLCRMAPADIRKYILSCEEFAAFRADIVQHLEHWQSTITPWLEVAKETASPALLIGKLENAVLDEFSGSPLLDKYDVYQRLMEYADDTLRDDLYLVAEDGWVASIDYEKSTNKKGEDTIKSWECELLPKKIVIEACLPELGSNVEQMRAEVASLNEEIKQMEEEQATTDGYLGEDNDVDVEDAITRITLSAWDETTPGYAEYQELKKYQDLSDEISAVNKALKADSANTELKQRKKTLAATQKIAKQTPLMSSLSSITKSIVADRMESIILSVPACGDDIEEWRFLKNYRDKKLELEKKKQQLKSAEQELDSKLKALYAGFSSDDVRHLVVQHKWLRALCESMIGEASRLVQDFAARLKVLAERYERPLPDLESSVLELQNRVQQHLAAMGFERKGEEN